MPSSPNQAIFLSTTIIFTKASQQNTTLFLVAERSFLKEPSHQLRKKAFSSFPCIVVVVFKLGNKGSFKMSIPVRRQFSRDPYWFDDYMFDHHARRPFDQDFGSELDPDHFDQEEFLLPPPPSWFRQAMLSHFNNRASFVNNRLGRCLRRRGSIGGIGGPSLPSEINFGRGKMQVTLDVTHFAPEDLNVKLVDNYLVIEGQHEEKQEGHGFISRHFLRRYEIASSPDFEVKPEDVHCNLNTNGVLTVEVLLEPPVEEAKGNEKVIPINMTTNSTSSKQFRHSSVHVKATEDSAAAAATTAEYATVNGTQE